MSISKEVLRQGTNAAVAAAHDIFGDTLPEDVQNAIYSHPPAKRAELARVIRRIAAQSSTNTVESIQREHRIAQEADRQRDEATRDEDARALADFIDLRRSEHQKLVEAKDQLAARRKRR